MHWCFLNSILVLWIRGCVLSVKKLSAPALLQNIVTVRNVFLLLPRCIRLHVQKGQNWADQHQQNAGIRFDASITQISPTAVVVAFTPARTTRLPEQVVCFLAGFFWTTSFPVDHDLMVSNHQLCCEFTTFCFFGGARHCFAVLHAVVHWGSTLTRVALKFVFCKFVANVQKLD